MPYLFQTPAFILNFTHISERRIGRRWCLSSLPRTGTPLIVLMLIDQHACKSPSGPSCVKHVSDSHSTSSKCIVNSTRYNYHTPFSRQAFPERTPPAPPSRNSTPRTPRASTAGGRGTAPARRDTPARARSRACSRSTITGRRSRGTMLSGGSGIDLCLVVVLSLVHNVL